jgi:hypothetical protein
MSRRVLLVVDGGEPDEPRSMTSTTVRPVATLVLAYSALTYAAYLGGQSYLSVWLPLLGAAIDWLLPADLVRHSLGLVQHGAERQIFLSVVTTVPIRVAGKVAAVGTEIQSATLQAYALHHVAIVLAIAAAWPVRSLGMRLRILAFAVLAILFSTLLDIPFVLVGLLRELWLQTLEPSRVATDPLVVYYTFLHRGGRLGLAVVAAVVAAAVATSALPKRSDP